MLFRPGGRAEKNVKSIVILDIKEPSRVDSSSIFARDVPLESYSLTLSSSFFFFFFLGLLPHKGQANAGICGHKN